MKITLLQLILHHCGFNINRTLHSRLRTIPSLPLAVMKHVRIILMASSVKACVSVRMEPRVMLEMVPAPVLLAGRSTILKFTF